MTTGGINATGQIGPYLTTGKELQSKIRGPFHNLPAREPPERIEANVRDIKFDNYQFVVETTMGEVELDDGTIALNVGGTHMDSGWFVTGVSFEQGECCLGTEKNHPERDLCLIKGPKIGSILKKKVKIATVYFKKRNHLELWTNLGDGWKKQVEEDNVGGFNPKSDINEAQERVEGFVKGDVPQLHMALVQEIVE